MAGATIPEAAPEWKAISLAESEGIIRKYALGSGPVDRSPNMIRVDSNPKCAPDILHDLTEVPWPIASDDGHEFWISHLLEHFEPSFIVPFFTELYRVCADKALIHIFGPHWAHEESYSDPTHKWRMTKGFFHYVSRQGRKMLGVEHYDFKFDFKVESINYTLEAFMENYATPAQNYKIEHENNIVKNMAIKLRAIKS